MPFLAGRVVAVTGAGQGLGRAYAIAAAAEGASLVVNDVQSELADAVAAEIAADGGTAVANHDSVATWAGAGRIIHAAVETFGRLDGLVNNAGIMPFGQAWLQSEDEIQMALDVNLAGTMFCGVHALRVMVQQRSGSIVNVTSGAQMGLAVMSTYGATKAGIAGLTFGWAIDAAPFGIRVNAIWPSARTQISAGYMQTEFFKARGLRTAVIPPEVNAPLVVYLLSELSDGITGQVIALRGRRLGIISHPDWTAYVEQDDPWQVDQIAGAIDSELRPALQPLSFADWFPPREARSGDPG